MCSRGSPIWLGTRREPGRAGAKPGGAGRGGVPFAVGVGSWRVLYSKPTEDRSVSPKLFPRQDKVRDKPTTPKPS